MNPPQNSNQNPPSTSAVQQVNPVMNQPMFNSNVGGLFPNNLPIVTPPGFTNFPNQPFLMQNTASQFPNSIRGFNPQQNPIPFPMNQFNPSQQGQFFAHNSMNPTAYPPNVGLSGEQALLQNTIQNIYQLLQLQNPNYAPGSFPMFQNPIVNAMNPQNLGFPMNQQFVMANGNGPVQHANHGQQITGQQLQGNPFAPGGSGSVQSQQPQNLNATLTGFQNQIPQNQSFFTNQMFGMANLNGPMQNVTQGQPGFVSPMMDANGSRQMVNMGQTHNPSPTLTKNEDNHKTNVNGGWTQSQHKNFTGNTTYDHSHKGSMSHKHAKQKFGKYKGNMNKEGSSNLEVDSVSQNSTNFEKKIPSLTYTDQEIKEWREARKNNYPTKETVLKNHKKQQTLSDAVLRRQQLKEILAKQAELGIEVADIPGSYLSSPGKQNHKERKHERRQPYKKEKFNKRITSFQDGNRAAKKARRNSSKGNHETKPNKRQPSLLQKLLTRDIKREKAHLLQVLRFVTANAFFSGESLRFPSVVVRETNVDLPSKERTCLLAKVEEEEGEIID